ncbi:MAG: endonuclease MutS2 [Anaerolineales bacterium]
MIEQEYLSRLEYDKIVARLAENTSFSAGRELALALLPSTEVPEVRRRLQETTEAKELLARRADITIGGAHDVRPLARHAAIEGTLEPRDLLDIRDTLLAARRLRYQILDHEQDYPELADQAYVIQPLSSIIEDITRCLSDDGEVLDAASPALGNIRKQLVSARDRLLERLRSMVTSAQYAQYLQEPIVTERNGRYVIPLRVEFKGRIKGIVHDQSASGQTLFIEPLQTVELNNQWHELQLAERQEILRILKQLSLEVGRSAHDIIATVSALAVLDLAFAKARLSAELRAWPAELSPSVWPLSTGAETADAQTQSPQPSVYPLYLPKARHPLLDPQTVVPITVYLGGDFIALLVTGPNTGGKTVSLKTVGLLAAMNQAGLHIPTGEGARLPVFDGIFADIGDEQSIEQSLSTFSSHLTHIVDILSKADRGSLVLLDEVGAGTDPVEGAALAQALVAELLTKGCLTMCSTHYSQLKVYAFGTPGVENASVEFDVDTLSPTYRLTIGLPGRSNAFAIAAKLGLPEHIINAARALMAPEAMAHDALLERVRDTQDAAENALSEAQALRERVRQMEADLRAKLAEADETRRNALAESRAEGQRELDILRAEIAKLRGRIMRLGSAPEETIREVVEVIDRLAEAMEPPEAPAPVADKGDGALHVGDSVLVSSLGQTGELVQISGDQAVVAVGGFRLRTPLKGLVFQGRKAPVVSPEPRVQRTATASPGMELDLRGRRAEEALEMTDRYLNDAYLAGLPWVHIIHGKGTGVLKQVVRERLAGHPLVQSFRNGELAEGGDGITVVKLVPTN